MMHILYVCIYVLHLHTCVCVCVCVRARARVYSAIWALHNQQLIPHTLSLDEQLHASNISINSYDTLTRVIKQLLFVPCIP